MARRTPGAYFRIGNGLSGTPGGYPVHTPFYDFNDDVLPLGGAWLANVTAFAAAAPGFQAEYGGYGRQLRKHFDPARP